MKHPAIRAFMCCSTLGLLFGQASLLAAEPDIGRLHKCTADPDDARRLACYDKEMGRTPGQSGDIGMTPELMRKKQVDAGIKPPPPPQKEVMSAKVARVAPQGYGRVVVTLDNGQVWSQMETLDFPVRSGDTITIEPGVLGGLWMELPSRKIRTHVKRIS